MAGRFVGEATRLRIDAGLTGRLDGLHVTLGQRKPDFANKHDARAWSGSPVALLRTVWRNRELLISVTGRELRTRHRGSVLGQAWFLLHPLVTLGVFTFVFSTVLGAKVGPQGSTADFAVWLLAGLIVVSIFVDPVTRAPTLVLANRSLVTKVIFPVEIIPVVSVLASLFPACIGYIVLLATIVSMDGSVPLAAALVPLIVAPLAIAAAGLTWLLASLGVYLRDVGNMTAAAIPLLTFLSPVFFPLEAVPAAWRPMVLANPVSIPVENVRLAVFAGECPALMPWLLHLGASSLLAIVGFAWFQATRKGFADVL